MSFLATTHIGPAERTAAIHNLFPFRSFAKGGTASSGGAVQYMGTTPFGRFFEVSPSAKIEKGDFFFSAAIDPFGIFQIVALILRALA